MATLSNLDFFDTLRRSLRRQIGRFIFQGPDDKGYLNVFKATIDETSRPLILSLQILPQFDTLGPVVIIKGGDKVPALGYFGSSASALRELFNEFDKAQVSVVLVNVTAKDFILKNFLDCNTSAQDVAIKQIEEFQDEWTVETRYLYSINMSPELVLLGEDEIFDPTTATYPIPQHVESNAQIQVPTPEIMAVELPPLDVKVTHIDVEGNETVLQEKIQGEIDNALLAELMKLPNPVLETDAYKMAHDEVLTLGLEISEAQKVETSAIAKYIAVGLAKMHEEEVTF